MPLVVVPKLSRALCRDCPEVWFVFGDNMLTRGSMGQACIRGEPNAIGVPTKWAPAMSETAFFRDSEMLSVRPDIDAAFDRLESYLRAAQVVAWPQAGIGTGLAQLPTRAPKVFDHITQRRDRLIAIAREVG